MTPQRSPAMGGYIEHVLMRQNTLECTGYLAGRIIGHSLEDQLRAGGPTSGFQECEPILILKLMIF